jgi:uncharacterized membrane protein (UPF0127 family)
MALQTRYAALVALVVCIVALVYIKLPGFPAEEGAATTTPPLATSTEGTASTPLATEPVDTEPVRAQPVVKIGGQTVQVTIVDTPAKRGKGLSGLAALPEGHGMLFIFPTPDRYGFWMKDMNFSIDIVWISEDGVVVDLDTRVSPETYPAVFTPEAPAQYVLELPAGFAEVYTVKKGDRVEL